MTTVPKLCPSTPSPRRTSPGPVRLGRPNSIPATAAAALRPTAPTRAVMLQPQRGGRYHIFLPIDPARPGPATIHIFAAPDLGHVRDLILQEAGTHIHTASSGASDVGHQDTAQLTVRVHLQPRPVTVHIPHFSSTAQPSATVPSRHVAAPSTPSSSRPPALTRRRPRSSPTTPREPPVSLRRMS